MLQWHCQFYWQHCKLLQLTPSGNELSHCLYMSSIPVKCVSSSSLVTRCSRSNIQLQFHRLSNKNWSKYVTSHLKCTRGEMLSFKLLPFRTFSQFTFSLHILIFLFVLVSSTISRYRRLFYSISSFILSRSPLHYFPFTLCFIIRLCPLILKPFHFIFSVLTMDLQAQNFFFFQIYLQFTTF